MMEIYRGQHRIGSYQVLSQYNSLAALLIPDFTAYSPEDIVSQVKGNLQNGVETNCEDKVEVEPKVNLPQMQRACRIIHENKMSYNSKLHTFTVLGSESKPYALQIFPKAGCSCPSTTECYHLIAAKMYLGIEETDKRQKFNLSQLRKHSRKRQ